MFYTKVNRKHLSTFLRKWSAYTIRRPSISYQSTHVVHAWWCSTTFQHYSSRILGQHVTCPMDRSRRTYCVASRLPDLNPVYFHLWVHLKTLVYVTPVNDKATLWQQVEGGCQTIHNNPGIFLTCSVVHDKTCSVLCRSTRKTFGTLTIKCRKGRECPTSERRIFWTHVDMNFFHSCGV
jgi:hypothetical protein